MTAELIGRSAELGIAERLLEGLRNGPATLAIEGDAGIGKSTLFDAVVRAAERLRFRTLVVRAAEAEQDLAYAGLDGLLGELSESTFASLPSPLRRALDVALLRAEPDPAGIDHRAIGVAIAAMLDALSRDGPVVVAIDDGQWLDAATRRSIDVAMRRLPGRPIGLVEARRTGPDEHQVERGGPDGRRTRIRLRGLSLAALRALVEERTGVALGRSSLTKLEAVSAGNPLLALEIVRYLQRHGREVRVEELVPVPADVERLVGDRLAPLDAETRAALEVVAAIGPTDVERLVLVLPPATTQRAILQATDAGLVRLGGARLEFAHPLFASAVYAMTTASRRHDLHRLLADRLPDPVESARHLARATTVPDEAVAKRLEAAARIAASRGGPDVAAQLLEEARRLTPAGASEATSERTLELARVLWELGEVQRSVALAAEVEANLPPGPARGRVRLLQAAQLGWTAGPEASVVLSEAALADAADDPELTARARLRLAYTQDEHLAAAAANVAAARDSLANADPATAPPALRAAVALFDHDIRLRRGLPVSLAEINAARELLRTVPEPGERSLDLDVRGLAREREWLILERLDDLPAARDALARMLAHDEAVGRDRPTVIGHADLAELHGWLGEVDAARTHVEAAAELLEQTGRTPHATGIVAIARAGLAALMGDSRAARTAVDEGLAAVAAPSEIIDRLRSIRGHVELADGRFHEAIRELDAVSAALEAAGIRHPSMYRYRGDAIEARVLAGDVDGARAAIEALEAAAVGLASPWTEAIAARSRALVASAEADLDGAIGWLDRAMERHSDLAMPVELGRTLLLLGQVRRRRKEKRLADDALRAAARAFEASGAAGWAARARAELDRVGLRPRAPQTLTPTEAEVARLAASGLTNRQVADAVVLSPKTIDGVLARVYAKLGIRSRAELGARMAAGAPEETPH